MRQSKITMRNGTTHYVRAEVEDLAKGAESLLEKKQFFMRLVDKGQQVIVIGIPEISTIEDAGLWRAPGL